MDRAVMRRFEMGISEVVEKSLSEQYAQIRPHLNERQRRLWAGSEALKLGFGGLSALSRATGMSINTIKAGKRELEQPETALAEPATTRVRRPGGGRKSATQKDPGLLPALDALVEPATRGDPMSPLRWTSKSTQKLADALVEQGHPVSPDTVARLLKAENYSLQATRKSFEGSKHPDRDGQFEYIARLAQSQLEKEQPVLSIDTKKKELVGNFQNKGQEWQPKGEPEKVNAYDFPSLAEGKAVPYGIYDVLHNEGWVSVGISADTSEFAVSTIECWWEKMGKERYEDADEIVLTADCGGSNSARTWLWKWEIQRLSNRLQKPITVLHYPPGTSKWNRIEHRMFNHISMNWRGRPLTNFTCIVESIANTTTSTGLRIRAELDQTIYKTGKKPSRQQMDTINIRRHEFHGEWNYTISPQTDQVD